MNRTRQRERQTAGENITLFKRTGEALGHNLNRRRLLRRQEMRRSLVPALEVSDPDRYQKEETYAEL